jgi:hypothetical protein
MNFSGRETRFGRRQMLRWFTLIHTEEEDEQLTDSYDGLPVAT